jgi:hypothetical protein
MLSFTDQPRLMVGELLQDGVSHNLFPILQAAGRLDETTALDPIRADGGRPPRNETGIVGGALNQSLPSLPKGSAFPPRLTPPGLASYVGQGLPTFSRV